MAQLTIEVNAVVTGIRIDVTARRLLCEGVLQNTATGETVRSFREDVTDSLSPAMKANLTALVTRAQTWADNKMVP